MLQPIYLQHLAKTIVSSLGDWETYGDQRFMDA
jgi:hypothetical protein